MVPVVRRGTGDERPELTEQASGGGPLPRAAFQAGGDQIGQFPGEPGKVRRLGGEPDQHVHHGLALVRGVPGGRVQQGRAQGEHVTGGRRLAGVTCLFRRHVGGGADGAAGHRELDPLGGPGHPEVDHPRAVR